MLGVCFISQRSWLMIIPKSEIEFPPSDALRTRARKMRGAIPAQKSENLSTEKGMKNGKSKILREG